MKKLMSLFAAVSMLSASVLVPRESHAFVGLVTGNAPVFVVGAVVTALNSGFVVSCTNGPGYRRCREGFFAVGLGGLIGLILMDGSNNASVEFAPLSAEAAARLGVTNSAQLDAYNSELPEINALRERIVNETVQRAERGQVSGAEVHAQWLEARAQGLISADAFAVLEAVSAPAARALAARN